MKTTCLVLLLTSKQVDELVLSLVYRRDALQERNDDLHDIDLIKGQIIAEVNKAKHRASE